MMKQENPKTLVHGLIGIGIGLAVLMVIFAVIGGQKGQPVKSVEPTTSTSTTAQPKSTSIPTRTWPYPVAIDTVVEYPHGNGIIVYFTLIDKDGNPTVLPVDALVRVRLQYFQRVDYEKTIIASASTCGMATIGLGGFSRPMLICQWGWISQKATHLKAPIWKVFNETVRVKVSFIYGQRMHVLKQYTQIQ